MMREDPCSSPFEGELFLSHTDARPCSRDYSRHSGGSQMSFGSTNNHRSNKNTKSNSSNEIHHTSDTSARHRGVLPRENDQSEILSTGVGAPATRENITRSVTAQDSLYIDRKRLSGAASAEAADDISDFLPSPDELTLSDEDFYVSSQPRSNGLKSPRICHRVASSSNISRRNSESNTVSSGSCSTLSQYSASTSASKSSSTDETHSSSTPSSKEHLSTCGRSRVNSRRFFFPEKTGEWREHTAEECLSSFSLHRRLHGEADASSVSASLQAAAQGDKRLSNSLINVPPSAAVGPITLTSSTNNDHQRQFLAAACSSRSSTAQSNFSTTTNVTSASTAGDPANETSRAREYRIGAKKRDGSCFFPDASASSSSFIPSDNPLVADSEIQAQNEREKAKTAPTRAEATSRSTVDVCGDEIFVLPKHDEVTKKQPSFFFSNLENPPTSSDFFDGREDPHFHDENVADLLDLSEEQLLVQPQSTSSLGGEGFYMGRNYGTGNDNCSSNSSDPLRERERREARERETLLLVRQIVSRFRAVRGTAAEADAVQLLLRYFHVRKRHTRDPRILEKLAAACCYISARQRGDDCTSVFCLSDLAAELLPLQPGRRRTRDTISTSTDMTAGTTKDAESIHSQREELEEQQPQQPQQEQRQKQQQEKQPLKNQQPQQQQEQSSQVLSLLKSTGAPTTAKNKETSRKDIILEEPALQRSSKRGKEGLISVQQRQDDTWEKDAARERGDDAGFPTADVVSNNIFKSQKEAPEELLWPAFERDSFFSNDPCARVSPGSLAGQIDSARSDGNSAIDSTSRTPEGAYIHSKMDTRTKTLDGAEDAGEDSMTASVAPLSETIHFEAKEQKNTQELSQQWNKKTSPTGHARCRTLARWIARVCRRLQLQQLPNTNPDPFLRCGSLLRRVCQVVEQRVEEEGEKAEERRAAFLRVQQQLQQKRQQLRERQQQQHIHQQQQQQQGSEQLLQQHNTYKQQQRVRQQQEGVVVDNGPVSGRLLLKSKADGDKQQRQQQFCGDEIDRRHVEECYMQEDETDDVDLLLLRSIFEDEGEQSLSAKRAEVVREKTRTYPSPKSVPSSTQRASTLPTAGYHISTASVDASVSKHGQSRAEVARRVRVATAATKEASDTSAVSQQKKEFFSAPLTSENSFFCEGEKRSVSWKSKRPYPTVLTSEREQRQEQQNNKRSRDEEEVRQLLSLKGLCSETRQRSTAANSNDSDNPGEEKIVNPSEAECIENDCHRTTGSSGQEICCDEKEGSCSDSVIDRLANEKGPDQGDLQPGGGTLQPLPALFLRNNERNKTENYASSFFSDSGVSSQEGGNNRRNSMLCDGVAIGLTGEEERDKFDVQRQSLLQKTQKDDSQRDITVVSAAAAPAGESSVASNGKEREAALSCAQREAINMEQLCINNGISHTCEVSVHRGDKKLVDVSEGEENGTERGREHGRQEGKNLVGNTVLSAKSRQMKELTAFCTTGGAEEGSATFPYEQDRKSVSFSPAVSHREPSPVDAANIVATTCEESLERILTASCSYREKEEERERGRGEWQEREDILNSNNSDSCEDALFKLLACGIEGSSCDMQFSRSTKATATTTGAAAFARQEREETAESRRGETTTGSKKINSSSIADVNIQKSNLCSASGMTTHDPMPHQYMQRVLGLHAKKSAWQQRCHTRALEKLKREREKVFRGLVLMYRVLTAVYNRLSISGTRTASNSTHAGNHMNNGRITTTQQADHTSLYAGNVTGRSEDPLDGVWVVVPQRVVIDALHVDRKSVYTRRMEHLRIMRALFRRLKETDADSLEDEEDDLPARFCEVLDSPILSKQLLEVAEEGLCASDLILLLRRDPLASLYTSSSLNIPQQHRSQSGHKEQEQQQSLTLQQRPQLGQQQETRNDRNVTEQRHIVCRLEDTDINGAGRSTNVEKEHSSNAMLTAEQPPSKMETNREDISSRAASFAAVARAVAEATGTMDGNTSTGRTTRQSTVVGTNRGFSQCTGSLPNIHSRDQESSKEKGRKEADYFSYTSEQSMILHGVSGAECEDTYCAQLHALLPSDERRSSASADQLYSDGHEKTRRTSARNAATPAKVDQQGDRPEETKLLHREAQCDMPVSFSLPSRRTQSARFSADAGKSNVHGGNRPAQNGPSNSSSLPAKLAFQGAQSALKACRLGSTKNAAEKATSFSRNTISTSDTPADASQESVIGSAADAGSSTDTLYKTGRDGPTKDNKGKITRGGGRNTHLHSLPSTEQLKLAKIAVLQSLPPAADVVSLQFERTQQRWVCKWLQSSSEGRAAGWKRRCFSVLKYGYDGAHQLAAAAATKLRDGRQKLQQQLGKSLTKGRRPPTSGSAAIAALSPTSPTKTTP